MDMVDFIVGYEEFKVRYFDAANNFNIVADFWNTYNPNPRLLITNRQYLALRDRLFGLLKACKRIDADSFSKIHKGHPFYFIGISSFLLRDFEIAIYFFDAAVSEELKFGTHPIDNPSPSTRFLMLDGDSKEQAAQKLTQDAQEKVERIITYYENEVLKDPSIQCLTLNDLRNKFILYALVSNKKPGLRTLLTAFITYCIEWDFRNEFFDYEIGKGSSEPFFLHLFRGCVLFESLLKLNPFKTPGGNSLYNFIDDLRGELKVRPINGKGKGRVYSLKDLYDELQNYDKSISRAIQVTYIARNTLGHDLGWNLEINKNQYQDLYFIIACSCLHAIACLWRGDRLP